MARPFWRKNGVEEYTEFSGPQCRFWHWGLVVFILNKAYENDTITERK